MIREFVQSLKSGARECPCCGRNAALAPYKIHSTIAAMLCRLHWIAMNTGNEWVHIDTFAPRKHGSGRDFSIVKHWGLAERMTSDEKRSSGLWRLTAAGVNFVNEECRIAAHAYVFNNRVVYLDTDKYLSIRDCLSDKFNYDEIRAHYRDI